MMDGGRLDLRTMGRQCGSSHGTLPRDLHLGKTVLGMAYDTRYTPHRAIREALDGLRQHGSMCYDCWTFDHLHHQNADFDIYCT